MSPAIAALLLMLGACGLLPAQVDLGRVIPADRPLHVVALGDFGSGSRHQLDVAHAIKRRNMQMPFDFGITMGDNFYRCGVHSVTDEKWQTRWEDLYSPVGIRFYASLGNHDYGHPPIICPFNQGSPDAEVAYTEMSKSWVMPARYYTFAAGAARFYAIDTEGWSIEQFLWLKDRLDAHSDEPGVRWRIVYGHHPMLTSGHHLNQRRIGALRKELLPVLKAAGVDLYVSGHDHDMEHLQYEGMDFLICGAGGAELRAPHDPPQPESVFTADTYGFLELNISEDHLGAQFFDTDLQPLEENHMSRVHEAVERVH
jgi:tartrate-resistant acid phosphatase type 5